MSERRLISTGDPCLTSISEASVNSQETDVTVNVPATGVDKDGKIRIRGGDNAATIQGPDGGFASARTQKLQDVDDTFAYLGDIPPPGSETLQDAYDASTAPQIVTTTPLGALTLRRGSALDTDPVIAVQNGAGTDTIALRGNGTSLFVGVTAQSLASTGNVSALGTVTGSNLLESGDGDFRANGVDYRWPAGPIGSGVRFLTYDSGTTNITFNTYGHTLTDGSSLGIFTTPAFDLAILGGTGITSSLLTETFTLALANTAVTPGSYTNASITVDQQGRLTAASSGATPATASFTTIAVPAGTNPVADSATDTLNLTGTDGNIVITGNSTSDTVDFSLSSNPTVSGTVTAGTGLSTGSSETTDGFVTFYNSTTAETLTLTAPAISQPRNPTLDDSDGTIALRGRSVVAVDETIPDARHGWTFFTDYGASTGASYLPSNPVTNQTIRFAVTNGDTGRLVASNGDILSGSIFFPGNATPQADSASGEYYSCSDAYGSLTVECLSGASHDWFVVAHEGTWTWGS